MLETQLSSVHSVMHNAEAYLVHRHSRTTPSLLAVMPRTSSVIGM
jgi:hypothetical protein